MEMNRLLVIGKKMVKASMQLQHLRNSREEGVVPKGIASQTKFTPSIQDDVLKTNCQQIMYNTVSRILDYMITYYETRARTLNASFYAEKQKIIQITDNGDRERIENILKEVLRKQKGETKKIHEKKMEKCRQEYRIYTPTEETTNNVPNITHERRPKRRQKKKKKRKPKRIQKRDELKGTLPRINEMTAEK